MISRVFFQRLLKKKTVSANLFERRADRPKKTLFLQILVHFSLETILKSPQSLTPLKIVVDDIELDENTSILFEDPTISLGPFAIYENYKVKFVPEN